MDNQKDVMRAKGKKKEGQRHALPPQIFNGDKYCGVSTKRQNELWSEVWKLFSQSSTDVPALLPCASLPRHARGTHSTHPVVTYVIYFLMLTVRTHYKQNKTNAT